MSSLTCSLPSTTQSNLSAYDYSPKTEHSNSSLEGDSLPYPSDDHSYQSRQEKSVSPEDASQKPPSETPQVPSPSEKHSSPSNILEKIILFGLGFAFVSSLFSKDKKTTKESIETGHSKEQNGIKSTRGTRKFHFLYSQTEDSKAPKRVANQICILFLIFLIFLLIAIYWGYVSEKITLVFKYFSTENVPLGIVLSVTLMAVFFIFFLKRAVAKFQKLLTNLTNKYFIATLAGLAFLGGTAALYIPSYTNWFRETNNSQTQISKNQQSQSSKDPSSDLRLHLLYITGGVIAVLGLIETNRKNSQEHIREVHAARRDRYIAAVDKLSSKHAPVRLGGVYALVGLADEWLEDDNIDEETRIKEGQVIVNNLCAYIRSPFKLAEKRSVLELDSKPDNYEGKFTEDQTRLFEEQEVRRSIFDEISVRLRPLDEKGKRDYVTWHVFEFDFRKSTIFYPLNKLRFFNPDFRNSKFFGLADFSFSGFQGISIFSDTHYFGDASFSCAHFQGTARFSDSCFEKELNFRATTLKAGAIFDSSIFKGSTIITPALQDGQVSFDGSIFSCSSVHKFLDLNHLDIPTINIKSVTLVGKRRCKRYEAKIPVNSHLYDPDSWDEKQQRYTRVSKPAE